MCGVVRRWCLGMEWSLLYVPSFKQPMQLNRPSQSIFHHTLPCSRSMLLYDAIDVNTMHIESEWSV